MVANPDITTVLGYFRMGGDSPATQTVGVFYLDWSMSASAETTGQPI